MKIVHVHTSDVGGGAESAAQTLHAELLALGHESWLYVGCRRGEGQKVIEIERVRGVPGLKRLTLKLEKWFGLEVLYAPGFRRLPRVLPADTDVVHVHSLHGAEAYADVGGLPGLTARFPSVMYLKDMWLFTGHCGHSLTCRRWREGCGRCPDLTTYPSLSRDGTRRNWRHKRSALGKIRDLHIATPSQWLLDRVKESGLFDRFPMRVIPNGIDLGTFRPGDRSAAKSALGIAPEQVVVMLVARDLSSPFKGIDQGISALRRVDCDRVTALVVGKDAEDAAAKLSTPVVAHPYQDRRDDMARCYQATDVLLMPSMGETFGIVAAEAMASGCAVLAYATGGLPEVIGDEGAGALVPTGDVDALTQALTDLVQDRTRLTSIGSAAADRAKRCFNVRLQAERFVELYHEAIAARQSR